MRCQEGALEREGLDIALHWLFLVMFRSNAIHTVQVGLGAIPFANARPVLR